MADDLGVLYTDRQLRDVERTISRLYTQAQKDIEQKMSDFSDRMAKREKLYLERVAAGTMTQDEFDHWKSGVVFRGKQWDDKMTQVSEVLANTNTVANNVVRKNQIGVFAMNGNYAGYELEHVAGVSFGFDLYDQTTVSRLLRDKPNILPFKKLDKEKDMKWNFKNIRSQVTQGILQGESIPKIAKRLAEAVPNRNAKQMVLHARTAMTAAQNGGRMERYKEAEDLGIKFKKVWLATLDGRTRDTHADLDGQAVKPDEDFEVDGYKISYPGDPHAAPEMVYNCRCTLVTELEDYPSSFNRRDTSSGEVIEDMSYREWEKSKQEQPVKEQVTRGIVNGSDLSGIWERRADQFDFEIEDIMNAQGFDGLPRVVSSEEFDKAVQESSFIAQRTYSASDQETLDAYRDQLYNGKWYVDCSTGGSQYGQGMYCAADYTGKISSGIQSEMKHYQMLNADKLGEISQDDLSRIAQDQKNRANEVLRQYKAGEISKEEGVALYRNINSMQPSEYLATYMKDSDIVGARSYIETITLDPSAKIIKYDDLMELRRGSEQPLLDEIRSLKGQGLTKGDEAYDNAYGRLLKARSMDDGSYATMLGYDAINAEGHGESSSYTVILNRTKLIIKGGR